MEWGTSYETQEDALKDCPSYCHVEICSDCGNWHIVQD